MVDYLVAEPRAVAGRFHRKFVIGLRHLDKLLQIATLLTTSRSRAPLPP